MTYKIHIKIFEPLFTTKKDHSSGDDTGTDWVWIIKSVVDEYDGKINLLSTRDNEKSNKGLVLRFNIPDKFCQIGEEI